jgi:hypothetical protein
MSAPGPPDSRHSPAQQRPRATHPTHGDRHQRQAAHVLAQLIAKLLPRWPSDATPEWTISTAGRASNCLFPDAEILLAGAEDPGTRTHSSNESQRLATFERACLAEALLLRNLARPDD